MHAVRPCRTMSAMELVHAFHCTRAVCPDRVCAEAKDALRRVEVHSHGCSFRAVERDAADGTPSECKMCRLWAASHRTRLVSSTAICQPCESMAAPGSAEARGPAPPMAKQHDDIVGLQMARSERRLPPSRRASLGDRCCTGVWCKSRQRLRSLGPAQVHNPPPRHHTGRARARAALPDPPGLCPPSDEANIDAPRKGMQEHELRDLRKTPLAPLAPGPALAIVAKHGLRPSAAAKPAQRLRNLLRRARQLRRTLDVPHVHPGAPL